MNRTQAIQNTRPEKERFSSGPTVLIVDECIAEYGEWASQNEAIALFARTAGEAVQLLEANRVDLCLVNLSLPEHSSGMLLGQIHRFQPSLPIIVLAVAENYDLRLEQIAWGQSATAFVAKPEHFSWLNSWVDNFQQDFQAEQDLPPAFASNVTSKPTSSLMRN